MEIIWVWINFNSNYHRITYKKILLILWNFKKRFIRHRDSISCCFNVWCLLAVGSEKDIWPGLGHAEQATEANDRESRTSPASWYEECCPKTEGRAGRLMRIANRTSTGWYRVWLFILYLFIEKNSWPIGCKC